MAHPGRWCVNLAPQLGKRTGHEKVWAGLPAAPSPITSAHCPRIALQHPLYASAANGTPQGVILLVYLENLQPGWIQSGGGGHYRSHQLLHPSPCPGLPLGCLPFPAAGSQPVHTAHTGAQHQLMHWCSRLVTCHKCDLWHIYNTWRGH